MSYLSRRVVLVRPAPASRAAVRLLALAALALVPALAPPPLLAQRPDSLARADSIRRARRDTVRVDSAAIKDSLRIIRELERIRNEPRATPESLPPQPAQAPPQGAGPTNPRLLPDVSAVGDLVGDLSPTASTQPDNSRLGVREVEVALQAAVDPFFRGDVFLGVSDLEKITIEQAYLTATSLPYSLDARLGRYLMPVGKQNTTHRHDLHTIEYPWVIQRFFSPEGLKGTGVWVGRVFAPFGFYQELQLTAVNRFGEAPEGVTTAVPINRRLGGLGYSARFRNYWDLNESTNFELSASGVTGRRERALTDQTRAGIARQSVVGADVTLRWRPLQQGLYRSLIVQAEVMRQINARSTELPPGFSGEPIFVEPVRDYTGGYAFARWQLSRRGFVGARADIVEDPLLAGQTLHAFSGYLEFFPSEFSKLLAGYEHLDHPLVAGSGDLVTHRILLQASFALGPHKPHPF